MLRLVREVFTDNNGHLSSKRIVGTAIVIAAIVSNLLGVGDSETNRVMVWAGVACLGVGTLETRVNKGA